MSDHRRETPYSPDWGPVFEVQTKRSDSRYQLGRRVADRPDTPMQALMEAPPFAEIEVSKLERLAIRDALVDALDMLEPRERWVFEGLFDRGLGLRTVGAELALSKTQVARIRDGALSKMRNLLEGIEWN